MFDARAPYRMALGATLADNTLIEYRARQEWDINEPQKNTHTVSNQE